MASDEPVQLKVEHWPIDRFIEYGRNPRKNASKTDKMVAAIQEFGFRVPIIALSTGLVVDGHLRLHAAKKLGLTVLPVALADGLSEPQVKAFRLLANRSATWADWDKGLVTRELLDLDGMNYNLEFTGFDPEEIEFYTDVADGATEGDEADPDDTPSTPVDPVTKLGDVWVLNKHRLVCGDSTDFDTANLAMNGVVPTLMVTAPPFIEYDPTKRARAKRANGKRLSTGKNRAVDGVPAIDEEIANWQPAIKLFTGDIAYLWHAARDPMAAQLALQDAGFDVRQQIIWAKTKFVVSPGRQYHMQHEPCFYAVRKNKTANWNGGTKQSTLWTIEKQASNETGSATQKPVECMLRPIENNSSEGQVVYDPFIGSGTTLMACELTQRTCVGIDLSPAMIDVAVQRWQEFTGDQAVNEETGKTYQELLLDRPINEAAE
jgi:DNA methylase/ParB-like nuclease domain